MALHEIIVEVCKVLIPPKLEDSPESQQRWRWTVFVATILIGSSLVLHICLAEGVFPQVFPGYAPETETQSIHKRLDVIATLSLEHEMREKMGELCREREIYRRSELNDDISKLQREYWDVNKQYYQIPGCQQL